MKTFIRVFWLVAAIAEFILSVVFLIRGDIETARYCSILLFLFLINAKLEVLENENDE